MKKRPQQRTQDRFPKFTIYAVTTDGPLMLRRRGQVLEMKRRNPVNGVDKGITSKQPKGRVTRGGPGASGSVAAGAV